MEKDNTILFIVGGIVVLYVIMKTTEKSVENTLMEYQRQQQRQQQIRANQLREKVNDLQTQQGLESETPVTVENFNSNNLGKAMRSFGRTADLNDTVYNARCNPNGVYYLMRYNQPSIQFPQYPAPQYPYTYGYYNACGNKKC